MLMSTMLSMWLHLLYIDQCCIEHISTFGFARWSLPNPWSFRIDCVVISRVLVELYSICILSICIMMCWTRYCIYRSCEEQIAKSLSQTDAHSHPWHDPCVWCNVSTRWSQNNQVKFDTRARDYVQRYLTNLYPKGSYFVMIERCEWSFLGSIFGFRAPNPPFGTKCHAVMAVFFPHSTIKGLKCVYRGAKGCYHRQNAVNDIRNLRKRIKLINLSKSRMKCLCLINTWPWDYIGCTP